MSVSGILGEIVERTLFDVQDRLPQISRSDLESAAKTNSSHRKGFHRHLASDHDGVPHFICEIKKASPSRGVLNESLNPAEQAELYREHGASAISVVTEPHFFKGEDSFLARARETAGTVPLLRKDFHVHELQVFEAAAGEADALLLLAGVLSPTQLKDYIDIADAFGLDQLVEVNNTKEAEIALKAGSKVIGVNNRDLTTFDVDLSRSEAVLPALRNTGVVMVSESGIHTYDDVSRLYTQGVHAFLVGEALVKAPNVGEKLAELMGRESDAS
ncbi:MAG: indole-3-glycerol phosphate synthase TrpC [Candidatus Eisenbacteria bacterium]|uniref:Indole-3-glycerol phosphate synthase n=1 Tax=Eiseniibacteriota bacterium TaxID=2212470 RepID=A0A7Y2H1D3_UNCEI|nr:indole-3-glycerol phosphate synthase TrpC [Candidatus Eisenbacteria bacterium]